MPDFSAFGTRDTEAAAATDFVDRLTEALHANLADEQRADLARLLRRV